MTAGAIGKVHVEGLKELIHAFNRFDKDLTQDLVDELAEAADPARKTAVEYIVAGGGGFPAMRGVAQGRDSSYWSAMRIGVSKPLGEIYIVPAWRSNKGTLQGQILAIQYRWRMEAAVEDKAKEIEQRMGDWLDTLADEWGSQLAA